MSIPNPDEIIVKTGNGTQTEQLPPEFRLIVDYVEPHSYVLDLGCGSGTLLKALQVEKHVRPQGIDVSEEAIQECVEKGLFVYHGDLNEGLADFNDHSVDYVISTNTLQVLNKPALLIREMVRVGKRCIISVPNFAFWKVRWHLLFKGTMPKTHQLPYEWYESPNIHLTTIKDFKDFCSQNKIRIVDEIPIRINGKKLCRRVNALPNLLADHTIFVIEEDR